VIETRVPTLRAAIPDDAEALAPFAQRVFRWTFDGDPDHRPEDMAIHLATALSADALRGEISDRRVWYFLAEQERAICGYLKLEDAAPPACVTLPRPLELARLYLDPAQHGRGLAQAFVRHTLRFAAEHGFQSIWLGVWHRNVRARRFYEKCGFVHCGEHPFLLGNDRQSDLVYQRPLALPAGASGSGA